MEAVQTAGCVAIRLLKAGRRTTRWARRRRGTPGDSSRGCWLSAWLTPLEAAETRCAPLRTGCHHYCCSLHLHSRNHLPVYQLRSSRRVPANKQLVRSVAYESEIKLISTFITTINTNLTAPYYWKESDIVYVEIIYWKLFISKRMYLFTIGIKVVVTINKNSQNCIKIWLNDILVSLCM